MTGLPRPLRLLIASRWWLLGAVLIGALALGVYLLVDELQNSTQQARVLSRLAGEASFKVEAGKSDAIRYPGAGPYDERLGYHPLPGFIEKLGSQGYAVTAQARMSPRMLALAEQGLFVPYREKDQAGLLLRDCRGEALWTARQPRRVYERFEAVPRLLVDALLFIENRELLDPQTPQRNPAVEWDRLGKAAIERARHLIDMEHSAPGGSTLATQIEKYRHSAGGRTEGVGEKYRQMASASLRAYLDGPNTVARRREIVVSYLNSVPLGAQGGWGEVSGIGDGLWAWYGRDFAEANQLLLGAAQPAGAARAPGLLQRQALTFRQALSLMIAQRRPAHYLGDGTDDLLRLTDAHLRVLADAGLITRELRDAALPLRPQLLAQAAPPVPGSFIDRKAATAVRARLSGLLDIGQAYDLDRLDLNADSSLDSALQRSVSDVLRSLREPAGAKAAGLYGFHLLQPGDDPSPLIFSFTLFERGERSNRVRVQTDNIDQPFDLNEGARLDLGSTAKLRTLVSYLEIVADAHKRWSELPADMLQALEVGPRDNIGRWAKEYLTTKANDKSLPAMLAAALDRTYSANPGEGFFTGGGLHSFVNFEPEDNAKIMSVRAAFAHSVNLVFIRLMRDVVYHHLSNLPSASPTLLDDPADPARREYLKRFADKEGRDYLVRFYRKYQGKTPEQALALLLQGVRGAPGPLASALLSVEPDATVERLAGVLAQRKVGAKLSDKELRSVFERHGPERLSLADRAYVSGAHPLELWLLLYLRQHPGAALKDVLAASATERQDAYAWLFKSRHKGGQNVRIRSLLEREAFAVIQRSWARLGYPFAALTPSYATALGASGDRPAALAELMGIIVNGGVRLPTTRIETLQFARATPFETRLEHRPADGERVLPKEVAEAVRGALLGVVDGGTAQRLKGVFTRRDGSVVEVGGKTGTGDHRFDTYGKGGRLISSRIVGRSATFVFLIGDRYFGTLLAYVGEPNAAKYKFTSALPAQLLKSLTPALLPLLDDGTCRKAAA